MDVKEALTNIYRYLLENESLLIDLRMGRGLDINKYNIVKESMLVLIQNTSNQETVPKKLALCFVDISNYFFYEEGRYSQNETEFFEDCGNELSQLANELFANDSNDKE